MNHRAKSIRPFLGALDYDISRHFYRDFGFEESVIDANMSYFSTAAFGFYLQKAYVKDWIDNTMIFMEVDDLDQVWRDMVALRLPEKYNGVRLSDIHHLPWGRECFLHDPSGILWHIGEFV